LFTMLFNGGLVTTDLVVKSLHITNTMWASVVPGAIGAGAILVARTFVHQTTAEQLVDASEIDGAGDLRWGVHVVLPLSMPIIAVMALLHAVALWNQYFQALIYLSDEDLFPLQLILRQILILNEVSADSASSIAGAAQSFSEQVKTAALVKYAVIIVSALPLLIIYPFLQRFFVKGVLIGSVKE